MAKGTGKNEQPSAKRDRCLDIAAEHPDAASRASGSYLVIHGAHLGGPRYPGYLAACPALSSVG